MEEGGDEPGEKRGPRGADGVAARRSARRTERVGGERRGEDQKAVDEVAVQVDPEREGRRDPRPAARRPRRAGGEEADQPAEEREAERLRPRLETERGRGEADRRSRGGGERARAPAAQQKAEAERGEDGERDLVKRERAEGVEERGDDRGEPLVGDVRLADEEVVERGDADRRRMQEMLASGGDLLEDVRIDDPVQPEDDSREGRGEIRGRAARRRRGRARGGRGFFRGEPLHAAHSPPSRRVRPARTNQERPRVRRRRGVRPARTNQERPRVALATASRQWARRSETYRSFP